MCFRCFDNIFLWNGAGPFNYTDVFSKCGKPSGLGGNFKKSPMYFQFPLGKAVARHLNKNSLYPRMLSVKFYQIGSVVFKKGWMSVNHTTTTTTTLLTDKRQIGHKTNLCLKWLKCTKERRGEGGIDTDSFKFWKRVINSNCFKKAIFLTQRVSHCLFQGST